MKRLFGIITLTALLSLFLLSAFGFTAQDTHSCTCSDHSGAYEITFSGTHADITHYSGVIQSAGLDVYHRIGAVCAYGGKVILLCDDSDNDQLVAYVYDMDSDDWESFAVYDMKLKNDTDFCCDDSALYIENFRKKNELKAYSYGGSLQGTYRLNDDIKDLFCGYYGGIYALSSDVLYQMSGNSFTQIMGAGAEPPLYPAGDNVLVSVYGKAYVMSGGRIINIFDTVNDCTPACACVVGDRLYCARGTMIYGYNVRSGETVSYYDCRRQIDLLYADGSEIAAVHTGSVDKIRPSDFIAVVKAGASSSPSPQTSSQNENAPVDGTISSDVYPIDFNHYQICGIAPETTAAAFKANMRYSGYSLTLYRDSAEKKSGSVGTAMTAVFRSDTESITFELAVTGDLTGEGSRNSRDLTVVMDYLLGTADFNGVYTMAADLSGDGLINVIDLAMMKRSI